MDRWSTARRPTLIALAVTLLGLAGGEAQAQRGTATDEWSPAGRLHAYRHDLFGPSALIGTAIASVIDHARDEPEEWGRDAGGFGQRVASNAGVLVVGQTTRHAVAIALGRSTRYQRCRCSGFAPRVGHAFVETFTDRNRAGDRALSVARITGTVAGVYAQRLWRPDVNGNEIAARVAGALVYGALSNAVSELIGWP
jgi:hypothetical protein